MFLCWLAMAAGGGMVYLARYVLYSPFIWLTRLFRPPKNDANKVNNGPPTKKVCAFVHPHVIFLFISAQFCLLQARNTLSQPQEVLDTEEEEVVGPVATKGKKPGRQPRKVRLTWSCHLYLIYQTFRSRSPSRQVVLNLLPNLLSRIPRKVAGKQP